MLCKSDKPSIIIIIEFMTLSTTTHRLLKHASRSEPNPRHNLNTLDARFCYGPLFPFPLPLPLPRHPRPLYAFKVPLLPLLKAHFHTPCSLCTHACMPYTPPHYLHGPPSHLQLPSPSPRLPLPLTCCCLQDLHRDTQRGYVAMLVVDKAHRGKGAGELLSGVM